jgi:hypothetical protein
MSSWTVTFHKTLLEIMFGHHILRMYLRHRLTKVCILRQISLVTSHVSQPYKSTDFTHASKFLILVSFHPEDGGRKFVPSSNRIQRFTRVTDSVFGTRRKISSGPQSTAGRLEIFTLNRKDCHLQSDMGLV